MTWIMLTTVIALISFSVAFIGGGMLSKAYFATRGEPDAVDRDRINSLLQAQRVRYRKRIIALNNVILRHEEARDLIREKLTTIENKHARRGNALNEAAAKQELIQKQNQDLRQQLAASDRRIAELESNTSNSSAIEREFGMLRIERDELAARISRMETELAHQESTTESNEYEVEIARMRAEMGELRETLATRDRRIHDLDLQLRDSTERTRQLQIKLDNWKQRVSPLTQKIKQQKELIKKFSTYDEAAPHSESTGDDLKAIQGIGPALERRLQQHGIRHYQQLADMTADELADIARKLAIAPHLAERDAWIQQARDLQEQIRLRQTA